MQTRKDDAALPYSSKQDDGSFISEPGLTKREYFAIQALQGILSNPSLDPDDYNPSGYAILAIEAADLLIYHLNQSANDPPLINLLDSKKNE
jgi:hypothetical protein